MGLHLNQCFPNRCSLGSRRSACSLAPALCLGSEHLLKRGGRRQPGPAARPGRCVHEVKRLACGPDSEMFPSLAVVIKPSLMCHLPEVSFAAPQDAPRGEWGGCEADAAGLFHWLCCRRALASHPRPAPRDLDGVLAPEMLLGEIRETQQQAPTVRLIELRLASWSVAICLRKRHFSHCFQK